LVGNDPSLARCHYNYRKPLYFAVRENRIEVVAFLLESDPDPTGLAFNDSLLDIAHDRGYTEMQRLLVAKLEERHGASTRGEPVAAAIRERDLPKVRALLDASPGLLRAGDKRSNQPIHWAVMTRQLEVIDELLQRGADIDARRLDGARAIHLTNGDYHYRGWRDVPKEAATTPEEVFRHLVSRGATVDLGMAAATGDLERVRELLDHDPTLVNRVSDYGSYYIGCGAPIKNAAARGHLDIVRLLLERGADPNLPEEGIAPDGHALYSAAANGHLEIVKLLLEHGAHPNVEVESSADT
jgi:ankyrin repeat protein